MVWRLRELAERRKSETDRRVQALFLTERGEQFARDMLTTWKAHEDRMIEKIGGPAERDRLIALVSKLTQLTGFRCYFGCMRNAPSRRMTSPFR